MFDAATIKRMDYKCHRDVSIMFKIIEIQPWNDRHERLLGNKYSLSMKKRSKTSNSKSKRGIEE